MRDRPIERIIVPALVAVLVACDSSPSGLSAPTTLPGVSSLRVSTDTGGLVAGRLHQLRIEARDSSGNQISTDKALVTSSDPAVAALWRTSVTPKRDSRTGQMWYEQSPSIGLLAAGTATVRVTLRGVSDSIVVNVRPQLPSDVLLVVDSFSVVEFRAGAFFVYAPLLKLREPTGKNTVELTAVEFSIGSRTTGLCRDRILYAPGLSAYVDGVFDDPLAGIYDVVWSSDLIIVSSAGRQLTDYVGTARAIMRDAEGRSGEILAIAPVQRPSTKPTLPDPQWRGWQCEGMQ